MFIRTLIKVGVISMCLLLVCQQGFGEELQTEPEQDSESIVADESGRLFDLKVPDGFKSAPVDEPGILKWKKGSAEIYLVVGSLFVESGDLFFNALRKAAAEGKGLDKVEVLNFKGGKAMLLKDKPPKDQGLTMTWRLVVLMDKKVINLDFSAPVKDFDSFRDDFIKTIESFKLKPKS